MTSTSRVAGWTIGLAAAATAATALLTGGHGDGTPAAPGSTPTASGTAPACPVGQQLEGLVTKVTDGDTVHVDACGGLTVRVIGLDTPETKKPRTPVQCYGPEASRFATQQLFGRRAALIPDRRAGYRDKYGRWLFRIEVNGQDYAELAIRAGYGRANDFGHREAKTAVYAAAQQAARDAGVGLWGACPQ